MNIPNSVTSIGDYAFSGCSGLTSVTIEDGTQPLALVSKPFSGCPIQSLYLGRDLSYNSASSPFRDITSLTSLTVGNSVTSIGKWAFYNCSGLTSVTIPNSVTSIGFSAFNGCSRLTSLKIEDSNKTLSLPTDYSSIPFSDSPIEDLYLGRNLSYVSLYSPFKGKTSLISLTIGNNVTSIGDNTFEGCSGLNSIIVDNANPVYDSRNNCNAIIETVNNKLIAGCINTTILNSVKSIGNGAFSGCSRLTSVSIPNSVTSIGGYAFRDCSGLTAVNISDMVSWCRIDFGGEYSNPLEYAHHLYLDGKEITDLFIPNTTTSIGNHAFSGCSGLTSVSIPNSIISIGYDAFKNCSGLTSVAIGNNVTEIRGFAFLGCNGLTSVHISDIAAWCNIPFGLWDNSNPLQLAHHLYMDGKEIIDLIIPTNVSIISSGCFAGCSALRSINIPSSVKKIGHGAFANCSGLVTLTIPNTVTSIDEHAFQSCKGLSSVTIGNSITSIKDYMFDGCNNLSTVNLSNNIVSIGQYAFRNCSSLKSIKIPNSVATLCYQVFANCSALTEIYIGKGIKDVYGKVFENCINLQDIYCYATSCPQTKNEHSEYYNNDSFAGCPINKIRLHVPAKSVEQYKTQAPWNQFRSIEPIVPTNQLVVLSDAGYATFYDEMYDYILPTDLKAYIVTNATDKMLNYALIADGEQGGFVPANVAVLLKGKERRADSYVLAPQENTTSYTGPNLLHGSDDVTTTTAEGDCLFYKLAYGPSGTEWSNTVGWFWGADEGRPFEIEGHKAWLAIPKGSSVKSRPLFYSIDGNAIELELVEEVATDKGNGEWYDLQGRRLNVSADETPALPGVYIHNGKKVFIK